MGVWLVPLLGGLVLYGVMHVGVRVPGLILQAKFVKLGTVQGRQESEIIASVGPPTSRSATGDGYLLQWMASGYHIALTFSADQICRGVTHEATG